MPIRFGPSRISNYDNPNRSLTVFGPLNASGNVIVGSLRTFGPLNSSGTLDARFVSTMGPLDIGADAIIDRLKTNGPATVHGDLKFGNARINGPVEARMLEGTDFLTINGPLQADSVFAGNISLNGPVEVRGLIEASKTISIQMGYSSSQRHRLQAEVIRAPEVRISTMEMNFAKLLLGRIYGNKQIGPSYVPEINVPIEAETVILRGVKHTGLIKAKNILLENNAEYIGLLEE